VGKSAVLDIDLSYIVDQIQLFDCLMFIARFDHSNIHTTFFITVGSDLSGIYRDEYFGGYLY